tara:strand:- start:61 stop:450 length:390 start_codon:yes stop_codon:yes gene_type:complete
MSEAESQAMRVRNVYAIDDLQWFSRRDIGFLVDRIARLETDAVSNWQPRETAPKDGLEFIAWDSRGYAVYTMHWDHDEFLTECEPWSGRFTHWMPALDPPELGTEFFENAILNRPGENVLDTLYRERKE